MSYFVSFMTEDAEEPVDGDHVASTTGWYSFGTWALNLPRKQYPVLWNLANDGACDSAAHLDTLEEELARAVKEKPGRPSRDVLGVVQSLLTAVSVRPKGAGAMVVTDGTEGGGDEEA